MKVILFRVLSAFTILSMVVVWFLLHTAFSMSWGDWIAYLPNGYQLVRCNDRDKVVAAPRGSIVVLPKVLTLGYDSRFVMVKREEVGEGFPPRPTIGSIDYWIIDTLSSKVYGPMDESGYNNKRKELGISVRVKLKNANSYSPHRY
jgi:hypothetical protein